MKSKVTTIHPFDLGAMLDKMTLRELQNASVYFHQDLTEFRGRFYKEATTVPIKSSFGKRLLKTLTKKDRKLVGG